MWFKLKFNSSKLAISLLLSLQISLQPLYAHAQNNEGPADQQNESSYQIPAEIRDEANADAQKLADGIDSIEKGELSQVPMDRFDQFKLANQRVEIYEGGQAQKFSMNEYQVEIPTVTYTGMKILFDQEKKELVFEATRGADKNGKNGTVVARQYLSGVDLVGSAQDPEMFSFVDSKGRLHAIDLGFVSEQLFKSPIPVFQNLWEPQEELNLKNGDVKMGYLTLGTKPFSEEQLTEKAVLPRGKENQIQFTAGDIAVEVVHQDGSPNEVLGVFSREVAYQRMIEGAQTIRWMTLVASPNNENIELAEGILKQIENNKSLADAADMSDETSPLVKQALSQIKPEQLNSLVQSAERNQGLSSRTRGRFSLQQWQQDYQSIVAKMKSQNPDVDEKTIAEFWSQGIEAINVQSPLPKPKQSPVAKILTTVKDKISLKVLAKVLAVGVLAYVGLPYAFDAFTAVQQIKVISWAHQFLYPAILKDAVYRTPLLLSTVSLIAIWPAAVAISAVTGKAFKIMAGRMQGSDSKMAQNVRDLARNWGDLNNWQRITTGGMRLYAWLIYPYWRVMAKLLRQKTFFTALENGLNPMTLVKKDSALGRQAGLTEDTRIGLNSIIASQAKLVDKSAINLKLQSALADQKIKMQNMAWAVASLVVSEKHKIDPSTLLMVSSGKLDLNRESISSILSDPEKKKDWEAIADQLIQDYAQMSKNGVDLSQTDAQMLSDFYQKAQEAAEKIESLPSWQRNLLNLKLQFKKKSRAFLMGALNVGKADHEFLKKVYTDDYTSQQVQQEFTIDHLMVVGIVAFYGERADLSNPSQLAANPNGFLWTSSSHWNDIFLNTFAHFFVSGSQMTLVFQKPRPQTAKNYGPKEDYLWVSQDRPQGFKSGVWSWIKDVSNPLKADIGGVMLKRLSVRAKTFTANLTMNVGIRTIMLSSKYGMMKALALAKSAWIFNFFAGQWFYGFVWDPIQTGNRLEGERFARQESELKQAKYLLSQGDYAKGFEKMMALYFESNPQDLMKLELTALRNIPDMDLRNQILDRGSLKPDMNSPYEKYYFGLLADLAFAISDRDQAKIDQTTTNLKKLLARDQSLDEQTLGKLTAESLLKFSVSNPPTYTRPNSMITWLATWNGAVWSTVLMVPLSVILTTNSLMASPLFIAKWIAISLSLYGVSYLTLSRTMAEKYIAFYQNNLKDRLIVKMVRDVAGRVASTANGISNKLYQKQKANVQMIQRCEALF
jgi:hypothetical protein